VHKYKQCNLIHCKHGVLNEVMVTVTREVGVQIHTWGKIPFEISGPLSYNEYTVSGRKRQKGRGMVL